jgi:MFS family permease
VPAESTTYSALFRIPAFPRLALSVLFARTANQMLQLALVLFVLQRFHSPTLAGVTIFLSIGPGIVISPLAGALLDRHGRVRLITLDYLVGTTTLGTIVLLAAAGLLGVPLLLILVTFSSLTYSLSNSGSRSMLPLIVPKHFWDRANALDSNAFAVTAAVGPALAGGLTALSGASLALLTTAACYLAAAAFTIRLPEPRVPAESRPVVAQAWAGLKYVLAGNPTLRGILIVVSVLNVGAGILVVALPVMVLQRLNGNAALVGLLWAINGFASMPSALIIGRFNSEGKERLLMMGFGIINGLAVAIFAFAGNFWVAAVAMLLIGLSIGPFDVAMFSLRQRRTDPGWYGRAFAVSMGLNFAGQPIGSALSGPLVHVGLFAAFLVSAALTAGGSALAPLVIPAESMGKIDAESARQSRRDRPVEESPSSAEQGAG